MKKVLFFIPTLGQGGAEKVLVNLVNNMDKEKYQITLKTLFDHGVNKQYLDENIIYSYVFKKVFRGNTYLLKIFSPKLLYKIFIKEEYDVVIAYLEQLPTRILAGCPDNRIKKVAWIHVEIQDEKKFFRCFKSLKEAKWCYEQYDSIIGVSKTAVQSLESIIGMKQKMNVIYNTVESNKIILKSQEEIKDIRISKEKINLISVGRLTEQKGYDRLLRIYKKLIEEGLKLHLYLLGIGELEEQFKQYIKKNNLEEVVTFLGYKDNPYKYVKNADLFICSSYREGFSTAVTESLIVGTPVITTLCSGMEEMLENGKYGVIVKNNEEALYRGVKELLYNPEKLQYYKEMAIERGKFFNTESTVKDVQNLIDSV